MKNYLLMATAVMAMASCANDTDLSGGNSATLGTEAIAFNMNTPAATRADGDAQTSTKKRTAGDAASDLGSEFIVWGEKNEGSDNAAISDLSSGNVVFENYRVQYNSSTANTTESNTKDWEYVGITPYNGKGTYNSGDGDESTAKVSPSVYNSYGDNKQTIKYWDFGKQYTFTAVSAKQADIKKQLVKITKNYSETTAANKGYTIELGEGAAVDKVYVADRQEKTLTSKSTNAATDAVTLNFRNFMSKIRFGIYETVPGYKVVITGIKYTKADGLNTETTHTNSESSTDKKFGIDGQFIKAGDNTKYKVTYTSDNKAQVALVTSESATPASDVYKETEGTTWLSTTSGAPVSTNVTAPTYDNVASGSTDGKYTTIMPNPSNSTNMKLQISFKLISDDTGEVIEFKETNGSTTTEVFRTVEVPAAYCQWKSNYAYTYLFKITDKSAELYPITFDAVVVEDENGTQEITTEVLDPSITTMGVKDNKVVTGKNEYEAGSDIYASVVEKNNNKVYETVTLTTSNVALYTVTYKNSSNATKEITEASVANCIANGGTSDTKTVTDLNGYTMTATPVTINSSGTTLPLTVTAVPTEEGSATATRNLSALKWNGSASTTYAIQYKGTDNKLYYKIVKIASND